MPSNLDETYNTLAVQSVDGETITTVWMELNYQIDVCRVNCGKQIKD